MNKTPTRYDIIIEKLKNNWIVTILSLCFGAIILFGNVAKGFSDIFSFIKSDFNKHENAAPPPPIDLKIVAAKPSTNSLLEGKEIIKNNLSKTNYKKKSSATQITQKDNFSKDSKTVNPKDNLPINSSPNDRASLKYNEQLPTAESLHNDKIDVLISSLKNISSDYYVEEHLENSLAALNQSLTGTDLMRIIEAAKIEDDYRCSEAIISASKFLKEPISATDMESILATISNDYHRKEAASALYKAKIKN